MKPSRQFKALLLRVAGKNLCMECKRRQKAPVGELCFVCADAHRVRCRNRYRTAHGIPLDAPLGTKAPKKIKEPERDPLSELLDREMTKLRAECKAMRKYLTMVEDMSTDGDVGRAVRALRTMRKEQNQETNEHFLMK